MFERGLVEEVRGLLEGRSGCEPDGERSDAGASGNCVPTPERGNEREMPERGNEWELSKTARQAVGYREVIEHLEGKWSIAETIEFVKTHTRQLAKRQCTWFRSLSECRFVPVSGKLDLTSVVDRIEDLAQPR
jgi:tRNA A37 N6-isopentenylltransferase MiaA